VLSTIAMSVAC